MTTKQFLDYLSSVQCAAIEGDYAFKRYLQSKREFRVNMLYRLFSVLVTFFSLAVFPISNLFCDGGNCSPYFIGLIAIIFFVFFVLGFYLLVLDLMTIVLFRIDKIKKVKENGS